MYAILGWLALLVGASLTVVGMGKMSQRIGSNWFLGILTGFLGLAMIFSLFVCTAYGPQTTMKDGVTRAPRTVKQLEEPTAADAPAKTPVVPTAADLTAPAKGKEKFDAFVADLAVDAKYKSFSDDVYGTESKVYEVVSYLLNSKTASGTQPNLAPEEVFMIQNYLVAEARSATDKRDKLNASNAEKAKVIDAAKVASAPVPPQPPTTAGGATGAAPTTATATDAGTPAVATSEALAHEGVFKKKCNACHTYKSVESKTKNYAKQNRLDYLVGWMQKMPNSGITKDEASKILSFLKATVAGS